jgi:hypothetical protein
VYEASGVGIKKNKLKDIASVMKYVPEEHQEFYSKIVSWKVDDADYPDSE